MAGETGVPLLPYYETNRRSIAHDLFTSSQLIFWELLLELCFDVVIQFYFMVIILICNQYMVREGSQKVVISNKMTFDICH